MILTKYDEIMDHIHVTEEMSERITANLRRTGGIRRFRSPAVPARRIPGCPPGAAGRKGPTGIASSSVKARWCRS